MKLSMKKRHIAEGYAFISIWIVGFFLFMAVPLGRSLYYTFNELKPTKDGLAATFVGLRNYRQAFTTDIHFVPLLTDTMKDLIVNVPLILIFAMFSAILLNRQSFGKTFFRGVFFLPVIIASGIALRKLLQQGAARLPIFNDWNLYQQLRAFIPGDLLEPLLEYADSLTLVMWDSGVQILIFLAALQTISPALYEAAKMDGATGWEIFWKITFPMLIPIVFVNTLFTIVNSFTNPDNGIMNHLLHTVFVSNNYAYGSTIGWLYFIFIFMVLGIVFLAFRRRMAY
ncbi:carbohydrate ABC transporter permease [Paenibacillus arenilitoris]|uniref:Sugar ABC transporter permease n=1 Tax=Paenibacillus arenilitoris TaxID=2772299 RepID=A0A927CKD4_9BACL|nr:sugar ABC transporter permease [Paenibacillus arenilitoris]MBD2867801.1 sugar ABC transporter permease [Paenibacillus arenilitoris]